MAISGTRFLSRVQAWLAGATLFLPLAVAAGPRDQDMARRASDELLAALSFQVNAGQIRAMIQQQRFEEFEALSREYEEKFTKHPKYESVLVKIYGALSSDQDLLPQLNAWVATRGSYAAYAARGAYRTYRGFSERGTEYSQNTPPEKMQSMARLHRQAIPDLLAALKENGRLTPVYVALIDIQSAAGDTQSAERTLKEAVRQVPETYYVRHAYLMALRPRWGGDYSLMQTYAATLDAAAARNPRIWSLKGEVPAELGSSAWSSKDYAQAIRYYTEALRFGDRLSFLKSRGNLYWIVRDHARAKADLARYLEYNPSDAEVSGWMKRLESAK
jgi:tetratricopeptide (TPR) repeat protein